MRCRATRRFPWISFYKRERLDEELGDVPPAGFEQQMDPQTMRGLLGIGADTAAEMLIVLHDNPERIRCEAAFSKLRGLAGASPSPTISYTSPGT